ncbi:hypothetical protein MIND_01149000 [Mycena indigotica]|uniref:Uncharacterized protein n=1 Tax=Mycena indigotica TaxID=2126181 RepID=A0A8H6S5W6_9AGAR|nr:uncharacterized protein MIND_01149000 [Mycena indigotica]KAF7293690.1 hypothetical protein MIND_01149000 [Mycena indigotica]
MSRATRSSSAKAIGDSPTNSSSKKSGVVSSDRRPKAPPVTHFERAVFRKLRDRYTDEELATVMLRHPSTALRAYKNCNDLNPKVKGPLLDKVEDDEKVLRDNWQEFRQIEQQLELLYPKSQSDSESGDESNVDQLSDTEDQLMDQSSVNQAEQETEEVGMSQDRPIKIEKI